MTEQPWLAALDCRYQKACGSASTRYCNLKANLYCTIQSDRNGSESRSPSVHFPLGLIMLNKCFSRSAGVIGPDSKFQYPHQCIIVTLQWLSVFCFLRVSGTPARDPLPCNNAFPAVLFLACSSWQSMLPLAGHDMLFPFFIIIILGPPPPPDNSLLQFYLDAASHGRCQHWFATADFRLLCSSLLVHHNS